MGDRYILTILCPRCDLVDDECYYAPTCDFTHWTCERCGYIVDLEEYTGISKESCSNKDLIEEIIEEYDDQRRS